MKKKWMIGILGLLLIAAVTVGILTSKRPAGQKADAEKAGVAKASEWTLIRLTGKDGKTGYIDTQEIGKEFASQEEFDRWLAEQKGYVLLDIYDESKDEKYWIDSYEQLPADAVKVSYRQPDGMQIEGWYAVNEKGETYGTSLIEEELANRGTTLDLVLAVGDKGVYGFLRTSEEPGAEDVNRYESFIYMMTQHLPKTINLYASDGVTVVDTFTTQPGNVTYDEGKTFESLQPFRYATLGPEFGGDNEPYGTFEMAENVEADGKKLDLILSCPWKTVLGRSGLIRQSELGCDCHSREEFEAWLETQPGDRYVKVYNELNLNEVIDFFRVGPAESYDRKHFTEESYQQENRVVEVTYQSDDAATFVEAQTGFIKPYELDETIENEADFQAWAEKQTKDVWVRIYDADGVNVIDYCHILPDDAVVWTEKTEYTDEKGETSEEGAVMWYAVNEEGLYYGNCAGSEEAAAHGLPADKINLDLVAAVGDHGIGGYMDTHEDHFETEEEFQEYLAHQYDEKYRFIYDCSGKTAVDWWHQEAGVQNAGFFGINEFDEAFACADTIETVKELYGKEVDLIAVTGENGTDGFVRQSELGCDVTSQGGFDYWLRQQTGEHRVPVYEADSRTVVDTFVYGK